MVFAFGCCILDYGLVHTDSIYPCSSFYIGHSLHRWSALPRYNIPYILLTLGAQAPSNPEVLDVLVEPCLSSQGIA